MKKIAIIDDNIHFLNAFQVLIGMIDSAELCIKVESGNQFLNHPGLNEIDIAFIDLNMPEIDGLVLTQKVKSFFPGLKIIAISSDINNYLIKKLINAGAITLLDKNELNLKIIRDLINSQI